MKYLPGLLYRISQHYLRSLTKFFIEIEKLQNYVSWEDAFNAGIEFFQLGSVYNNHPEDYCQQFIPDWMDYLIYFELSTATDILK